MGRRAVVAAVALALSVPGTTALTPAPFLPTTDLLPPVAVDDPAEDATRHCGATGLRCLRDVERQLARWEAHFGCDHRAVFATVYRLLTREARRAVEEDPAVFDDPAGLGLEARRFHELYEQMLTDHLAGRSIPPAWQVAMDVARSGDWTAGHDMLLAISAHVQRDMPFAVAEVGLVVPEGRSRKPDHDQFNRVLASAYTTIVQEVGRRYDPLMSDIEALPVVDDVGSQQLVALWREGVWRNAEALVTTGEQPLLREAVRTEIEANARLWAEAIATGQVPGRRALRDAHCEAALG